MFTDSPQREILSGFCEVEGNRLCNPEAFGGAKAWLRQVGVAQVLAWFFRRRLQAEGYICNNTELSPYLQGPLGDKLSTNLSDSACHFTRKPPLASPTSSVVGPTSPLPLSNRP